MNKRSMVDLTRDARAQLLDLLNKGVAPARKLTRARILLLADESNTDETIAAALHVHRATVERTRRRFVEGGIAPALSEKPRPGGRPKLDGKQAAFRAGLQPGARGARSLDHAASGRSLGRARGGGRDQR